MAQASLFNAGNSAYNTKSWEAAIESYRQALLRNPDDLDAKHNLELALQQQKQDQQKQDQQKQDQQKQDQQQQDQQKQDQQQQDQQKQDGQSQQDQQNQDQQNPSQSDQGQQDQQGQPKDGQQGDKQQGQSGKQQDGQPRPGSQLAPGQRMTQDQAKQLLAAIAGKSDTLQGRLGQFLKVSSRPPVQDW